MSFIKKFIEAEKVSCSNFLLASACGVSGVAAMSMFGPSPLQAMNYANPTVAWSFSNRTNPYWNEIVSGGEAFMDASGMGKDALGGFIRNISGRC